MERDIHELQEEMNRAKCYVIELQNESLNWTADDAHAWELLEGARQEYLRLADEVWDRTIRRGLFE